MTRYEYLFLAKLSEQARRYEDMVEWMDELVIRYAANELTPEERNLLVTAHKHVIDPLRHALLTIEQKDDVHVVLVHDYKSKVEFELSTACARILKLLDENLIPSASTSESRVFYLKTKGDYHRYLAEFKVGLEREIAAEDAMLAYKVAEKIARANLSPTNHVRLGLALNFSIFCYEIDQDFEKACSVARDALEDAVEERDALGHKFHKDSFLILQLLRDNFALWTSNE
ncbi:14-3-3 protein [Actinidia chinensis var. chinensis]|uniref:14-3-3 protein n=1 Tax=Actinidia chinensis var. chinensis TaxID=1590841 RepID=A0A2R6RF68_ACTCC|nr:14-3-3 protein [Actinidia chinensis var. chinensis]